MFGIHVTCVEPGPYATGFIDAVRTSDEMSDYAESRAAADIQFEVGDPTATIPAILLLVDSEHPPRRLILGNVVPAITGIYEDRIETWRQWEPISLRAFGDGNQT